MCLGSLCDRHTTGTPPKEQTRKSKETHELEWLVDSCSITNLLLTCFRWGFLQFSTDAINTTTFVETPNWPVYSSFIMLYEAEKVSPVLTVYSSATVASDADILRVVMSSCNIFFLHLSGGERNIA